MKNAYITMTEATLTLRRASGRLLQIEGRLRNDNPSVARAAISELNDVRATINGAMDQLVEVQAELPEPTRSDIVAHYSPLLNTVDAPMVKVNPEDLKGIPFLPPTIPGPGKSDAIPSDKRPAGWTETLALEFIGTQFVDCVDQFAKSFNEGDWPTIQKEWPEFQTFINKQLEGGHAS